MRAVLKKELKQFFHSMAGYVFLAIFLLLGGYYFTVGNLLSGNGDIRIFFSSIITIVMFLIPMLTMRSFSEERKMRTDQLLMASPISFFKIVIGKYLAVLTVFMAGMAVTLSYVVILAVFGQFDVMVVVGNYVGMLVAASAFIAIGLFLSALTENQVVAGVLSYSILMGLWLVGMVGGFMAKGPLRTVVGYLSLSNQFREFAMGIFSASSVVYYLSLTLLFLFLTTLLLEARRSGFHVMMAAAGGLAVGIAVLSNTGVEAGTRNWGWKIDMTADKLYQVTDTTKEVVRNLTVPVKITIFNTSEEFTPVLRELLDHYQLAGDKLTVQYKDPYENPALVDYYQQQGSPVTLNSIAIESESRMRVLETADLFDVDQEAGIVKSMTAEQQITSAVLSVTTDQKPEVQFVEGHNEEPSSSLISLFEQNNYLVTRKALSVQGIGPDTKLLVIAAPTRDFSAEEITLLDQFMAEGGRIMAFLPPSSGGLPELQEFLSEWGLGMTGQVVMEKDLYTDGNPLNIVPIYASHEINSYFSKDRVTPVLPSSQALEQVYQQKGKVSTQAVLYSSANSYGKTGDYQKTTQEEGDTAGPFPLALTSEKAVGGSDPARIFLSGSKSIYADDLLNSEAYANGAFLLQVMNWCTDTEASIQIPAKSMEAAPIHVMAYEAFLIGIILSAAVPLFLLGSGFVIYLKRRHL